MSLANDSLYGVMIATAVAIQSLIIAWSATSHRPRMLRALIAWAAIVALILIQAYIPALVFTVTAVLAWGLAAVVQRWQRPAALDDRPAQRLWRFQLSDVFVFILALATMAALFRHLPALRWLTFPLVGLPLAPLLVFAHYAVTGRSRGRMVLATILAIFVTAAFLVLLDLVRWLNVSWLVRVQHMLVGPRRDVTRHILLAVCLVGFVLIVVWLGTRLWRRPMEAWKRVVHAVALVFIGSLGVLFVCLYIDELLVRSHHNIGSVILWLAFNAVPPAGLALLVGGQAWLMTVDWRQPTRWQRLARGLTVVTSAVIAVPMAWIYWEMVRPLPFPPPPASPENNYERLASIAQQLATVTRQEEIEFRGPKTSQLVDEAVTLLDAPNFLPTAVLEEDAKNLFARRGTNQDLIWLPWHLTNAARAANPSGDFDRAAEYCLAAVRYCEMFQRGGTTANADFALSLQSQALSVLAGYREKVSAAKAREIIAAIERTLSQRDDFSLLYARERVYVARSEGWSGILRYYLPENEAAKNHARRLMEEHLTTRLRLRTLQTVYAIRLFQDEHRRLPKTLAELVPEFLPAVPIDSFSQQALVYRPAIDDFELYSVGRDHTDDGGTFDAVRYSQDSGRGLDLDLSW